MLPNSAERPVVTAEEAFAHLGVDRTTGYRAIREGRFPVEVIRIGRVIRIPTSALRRLLEIDVGDPEGDPEEDRSAVESDAPHGLSAASGTLSPLGSHDRRSARDPSPSPTISLLRGSDT